MTGHMIGHMTGHMIGHMIGHMTGHMIGHMIDTWLKQWHVDIPFLSPVVVIGSDSVWSIPSESEKKKDSWWNIQQHKGEPPSTHLQEKVHFWVT